MDDLIATGGSALAAYELIKKAKGVPSGFLFLCGLKGLKGEEMLENETKGSVPIRTFLDLDD